jgi:hypothetical protein
VAELFILFLLNRFSRSFVKMITICCFLLIESASFAQTFKLVTDAVSSVGDIMQNSDSSTIIQCAGQSSVIGLSTSPNQMLGNGFIYSLGDPWAIGCEYLPGDINGDSLLLGSDVTYGVRYLKGLGLPPPDSCWNDSSKDWFFAVADINGDCYFRGSDITYLVNYFKSMSCCSCIKWCSWTPPQNNYSWMCPR